MSWTRLITSVSSSFDQASVLDPFQPTVGRIVFAVMLTSAAFFLPQQIPLEYFPLNHPSSGLNYFEISCAATVQGETDIYLDTGRGFNESEKIRFPIGPSQSAYTYTFPLPDAPLFHLRLDPFIRGGGEFTILRCRIINRQGDEICNFRQGDFQPSHQITTIIPTKNGWKLIMPSQANDPYAQIHFSGVITPQGMNERNFKRCLLSVSYLAFMLWILLLAVYFSGRRTGGDRNLARAMLFFVLIAFLLAAVGNRGLIKNSIRDARYHPALSVEKN